MSKTKRTIKLTMVSRSAGIAYPDGTLFDVVAKNNLFFRYARKEGDTEVVNNYQYGVLKHYKSNGYIDFEELD